MYMLMWYALLMSIASLYGASIVPFQSALTSNAKKIPSMNSSDMNSSIDIPDKETKGMVQQTRESILGRTRHFILVDDEELSESEEHLEDDYESEDSIETTTQDDFVEELDDDEDEVGFGNCTDSTRSDGFVEEPDEDDDEYEPTNWDDTIAHEGWFEESDEEETEEPTTTSSTKPTKQTTLQVSGSDRKSSVGSSSNRASTIAPQLPGSNSISIARAWNQCGGWNWKGPKSCENGFDCVVKSLWYYQCQPRNKCPIGSACQYTHSLADLVPPSSYIPAYHQCNGNYYGKCQDGTHCFRHTATISACMPACPAEWDCQQDVVPQYEQCGGNGYLGPTRCADGLTCFKKNEWYSSCHKSCPSDMKYECAKNKNKQ